MFSIGSKVGVYHSVLAPLNALPHRCVLVTFSKDHAKHLFWLGSISVHRVIPFGAEGSDQNVQIAEHVWSRIRHLVGGDHAPKAALITLWIGA